jgi:hypothetical protein
LAARIKTRDRIVADYLKLGSVAAKRLNDALVVTGSTTRLRAWAGRRTKVNNSRLSNRSRPLMRARGHRLNFLFEPA